MIDGIAISAAIFEADFLINLPKFKTHSLTALTVCTKNLFGCVPGMMKTAYHRDNPDGADFVRLIVKLSELVRPALNLVDAIEAMEGDGPSAGRQIKISAILAGTDHHRVDAVCAKIAGVEPADVDTLRCAAKLDLWNASETIKIVGEDVSHFIKKGFKMPATFQSGALKKGVSKFLKRLVWPNLSSQPEIAHDLCVKCQLCVKSCPVAAISPSNDSFPEIDKDNCIQCFCCHEICPHRAIYLRQSLLTRLGRWYLSRTAKKGEKR
jgi:Pyruvate/2-oxoacid:ferredoxin oxidoreductase delta subunit